MNRPLNNNNWRLQYSTFNNKRNNQGKTNKEIEDLSNIINQLNLTDICRTLSLMTAKYACFSRTQSHTNIQQITVIKLSIWYWYTIPEHTIERWTRNEVPEVIIFTVN